jgi:hypothetical protein
MADPDPPSPEQQAHPYDSQTNTKCANLKYHDVMQTNILELANKNNQAISSNFSE